MRTVIQTKDETVLAFSEAMNSANTGLVSQAIARNTAIATKRGSENPKQRDSKDFAQVEKLAASEAFARLSLAAKINSRPVLYVASMSDADLLRVGIDPEARCANMKAAKKFREVAEYIADAKRPLEAVFMTYVACAIVASKLVAQLPRDLQVRTLSGVPLTDLAPELRDAIADMRAKHMSGGAETQSSQCSLVLANLKAARPIRVGKEKHLALDPTSPVLRALAQRFGMLEALDAIPQRELERSEGEAEQASE